MLINFVYLFIGLVSILFTALGVRFLCQRTGLDQIWLLCQTQREDFAQFV